MEGQTDSAKFQVVLPTQQLPPALKHIDKAPTPQFLVGYRNILVKKEQGFEWGLVKNRLFCGRAFVFEIGEKDANTIQDVKQADEQIEIAGNSYILLKKEDAIAQSTDELKVEQLKSLLELVGGLNKININLVQNAFNSYTEYKLTALEAVEALKWEEKSQELTVQQQVQLQFNAKELSGSCLLAVPMVSKDTGKKVQGELLPLNMTAH